MFPKWVFVTRALRTKRESNLKVSLRQQYAKGLSSSDACDSISAILSRRKWSVSLKINIVYKELSDGASYVKSFISCALAYRSTAALKIPRAPSQASFPKLTAQSRKGAAGPNTSKSCVKCARTST